jgi:hypothetical protein
MDTNTLKYTEVAGYQRQVSRSLKVIEKCNPDKATQDCHLMSMYDKTVT